MKRAICFFAAVFMLCVLSMDGRGLYILQDTVPQNAQFCFYTYRAGQAFEGERISVGGGEILICQLDKASGQAANLKDISGESIRFLGGAEDAQAVLNRLNAHIIKTENVGGIEIIYAKSPLLRGSLPVEGKRVNVQIAINNGFVTVGTPLILGSY